MRPSHRSAPDERGRSAAVRALLLPLPFALAAAAAAQPPGFEESQRLTAVDLVVGFTQEGFADWATDPAPRFPDPGDFEVRVDGELRPVVSVVREEPWDVVLWFQPDRSRTALLRRGALELAARADDLAALGPVTVVVADPAPTVVGAGPSEDPAALRALLGELGRTLDGGDELVGLRHEVRRELEAIRRGEGATGMEAGELVEAALAEEVRTIRRAHDRLTTRLVGRDGGARRLLVLVAGSYDLEPGPFWNGKAPEAARRVVAELEKATRDLEEILASYGWVVVGLHPEPEEPLRDGWTIGKWRTDGVGGEHRSWVDPVTGEENQQTAIGWRWKRESHRKPDRAEAYLELAAALRGQEKLDEAADAYRRALYHFAGHRDTTDRQAVALIGLGGVLEGLGADQEARTAFRLGRRLDPSGAEAALGPSIDPADPLGPLRRVVAATAGRIVSGRDDLEAALGELGRRIRLTTQLEGWPDGRVHPVEVALTGPWRDPVHPRWLRHSTPAALAEARLRLALADEVPPGPLGLRLERIAGDEVRVAVDVGAVRATGATSAVWRVATAFGGEEDGDATVHTETTGPTLLPDGEAWVTSVRPAHSAGGSGAVLVEDLATGLWGLSLLDG